MPRHREHLFLWSRATDLSRPCLPCGPPSYDSQISACPVSGARASWHPMQMSILRLRVWRFQVGGDALARSSPRRRRRRGIGEQSDEQHDRARRRGRARVRGAGAHRRGGNKENQQEQKGGRAAQSDGAPPPRGARRVHRQRTARTSAAEPALGLCFPYKTVGGSLLPLAVARVVCCWERVPNTNMGGYLHTMLGLVETLPPTLVLRWGMHMRPNSDM